MEQLQWAFPIATALSSNTPAYARMTNASGEGGPPASEAKGPLPAEEGWVMEKKEKRKRVKE